VLEVIGTPADRLRAELEKRMARSATSETLTRWTGYILVVGTLVASFGAFVMSLEGFSSKNVGIIAALAGLCTAVNTTFKFDSRADWFCRRKNAYRRLHYRLLFSSDEPPDVAAIAAELSVLQEALSADFPKMEPVEFKPPAPQKVH
jgi:hypothetical protein